MTDTYMVYADDLKDALLSDEITRLIVYGSDGEKVEYYRADSIQYIDTNEFTSEQLQSLREGPVCVLPSAKPEPLTDKEQRIFLAAMGREEQVCKVVDQEARYAREAYEDRLEFICKEIIRKVKGALWA